MALPALCALRHQVTIQRETRTADAGGGYVHTWTNVTDMRAEVTPISGREQLRFQQLNATITHRVLTRYRVGVTASMRLLFKGRPFNIRSVINLEERDRWLEMLCEEGAAT